MKDGSRGSKHSETPGPATACRRIQEGCQRAAQARGVGFRRTIPGWGTLPAIDRGSPLRFGPRLLVIPLLLLALSSAAQVQEAWIQRYNGGFTNLDHRPLAMAVNGSGSIYVAGSSQSTSSNYEYVVLKYASDGTQAWAARYAPPGGGTNTPNDFALDPGGDTYLTGTGGTVKFGAGGAIAWTAPYVGSGVAADTNGNLYVTGLSATNFATVKLNSAGSNVWLGTFNSHAGGPAASEKVAVNQAGNVYVGGWAIEAGPWVPPWDYTTSWVAQYTPVGDLAWASEASALQAYPGLIDVTAFAFDASADLYITQKANGANYDTAKLNPDGQVLWNYFLGSDGDVAGMVLDTAGNAYLAGGLATLKLDSASGLVDWLTFRDSADRIVSGIALDLAANVFVTGGIPGNAAGASDWVTTKYDTNGVQVFSLTYHGPANGDDCAVAIAVAPDGSIYVTGYSANPSGGTDITTIKYIQDPAIHPQPGGAMLLQLPGLPGSSAGLAATANFVNWTELGPVAAGTNGLFQFTDTNATLFPRRFYRWH